MLAGIDLLAALRQPLEAFIDPAERIFIPALLTSAVLAWLVLGLRGGTAAMRDGLCRWRIWGHPSSRADITMMFAKALVFAIAKIPWYAATVAAALWIGVALHDLLGPADVPTWDRTTIAVVYSVVLFVCWDLSRFAVHWLLHRVPVLWSFHQVHHSAPVLTPLTLYRVHPVESALYDLRGLLTTAAVTGVFLYLFRGTASELQLLGINAIGLVLNLAGGNLRHSHVWLRFGRLERWFISPAQHQLHHGRTPQCQRSNYGTWLAIWDRILGSWRPAPSRAPTSFGIDDSNHRFDSVLSMLFAPLWAAAKQLVAPRRWWFWPGAALVVTALWTTHALAGPAAPTDPRAAAPVDPPTWPDAAPESPEPTTDAVAPTPDAPEPTPDGDGVDFELDVDEEDSAAPSEAKADQPKEEEGEDEGDYDVALDQISIIGTPDARDAIGGSAYVIDNEELERKENDDLHRALRSIPGVYPREEDGFGLRPNIGIRGASSDRSAKVTLMEDGILLAPAPYSAPAAYYFPLVTRIVGIEVFKGPAAIRHGPNTIGGAINLQTRPVPTSMEGYVDAGLGMRGYGKIHGFWGTTHKGFGVLLEGARIQSNGFKELDGGGETGFDKNDFMVKLRYSSDPNRRFFHQADAKVGFATETSKETYLGLSEADFDATPLRRYAGSQRGRMKWWRSQAEIGYFLARGTIFDLQIRGYRHDFDRSWRKFNNFRGADIRNVLAAPDVGQTAVFYDVVSGQQDSVGVGQTLLIGTNKRRFQVTGGTAVAHVRPTWRWLEQDIEIGARVHHDQIIRDHTEDGYLMVSGTLVPEGTDTVTTTDNRGAAVAGAFHLLDTLRIRWFSLVPGARVEVIRTEFEDTLNRFGNAVVNTVFIPGIGAHAQATPWLGFLAGVHSGFSPVAPGQPEEVRPERSINYEAGGRVRHKTRRTTTRIDAIGFFNDYSNLTSVCTLSAGCDDVMLDRQFNAGRVFVWGLEFLASERIELGKRHFVEASASYTYTGSNFRTTFTSASPQLLNVARGDALPYVPVHLASFGVGAGGRIWGVFPSLTYVGDMRDVAGSGAIPAAERIPRHYVLDVSGQVSPTKRTLIYLNVQNVTNNRYIVSRRPFGARPGLPLQIMGGFKFHFI